jgi:hypothetical protein
LTSLEFSLIGFLIKHKDQVLDRSTILDEVWGKDVYVLPKTVDTHVGHLRKKIEDDPANPKHIIGVRHGMIHRLKLHQNFARLHLATPESVRHFFSSKTIWFRQWSILLAEKRKKWQAVDSWNFMSN